VPDEPPPARPFPLSAAQVTGPVTEHPLIPAATVVLLRDTVDGIEALMMRRNSKLEFAGGMWVFPGGRVDPADHDGGEVSEEPELVLAAARRAAVREALEEAGLVVDPSSLVPFSHWTPPGITPKRFSTWFFAAPAPGGEVVIDGGEIHDHAWLAPTDALRRRNALEIELAPPTWITLETLARHATTAAALDAFGAVAPERFATRFAVVGEDVVAMYDGDAGYEDEEPARDGGRHRLVMAKAGWRYERDGYPSALV